MKHEGLTEHEKSVGWCIPDSRHFDMNVNAVVQRTRDAFLIFRHDSRCTRTGFLYIPIIATWARVYTIGYLFRYQ
jgi:hypothetical protein